MKICRDVEEWIKENVEKKLEQQERRCKKWPWPLSLVCSVVTTIVRYIVIITRKITRVVCEVVTVIVMIIAAVINFIYLIPIIGPFFRAVVRVIATWFSFVFGLGIDGVVRLFGARLTKHLRVHVIPLCVGDIPLAYPAHLQAAMAHTDDILFRRAKIRVHTTFHEPVRQAPESALHVGTNVDFFLDQVWMKGTWFQSQVIALFESNLWLLLGVGHPIVVFVVKGVGYEHGPENIIGASGGPIVDWVVVERDLVVERIVIPSNYDPVHHPNRDYRPVTPYPPPVAVPSDRSHIQNPYFSQYVIAHELCHSMGLLGHENSGPHDLMYEKKLQGDALTPFQVGVIRNSPHVTYF